MTSVCDEAGYAFIVEYAEGFGGAESFSSSQSCDINAVDVFVEIAGIEYIFGYVVST